MKPDDILKLINAGYTKEEIQAMEPHEDPATEPKKEPEEPKKEPEEPKKEPEEPPQEPAQDITALDEVRNELQKTQKQLSDLVRQMQKNNLATASVNILPQNDLDKKTDEAMAELIRPSYERKGDKNVG